MLPKSVHSNQSKNHLEQHHVSSERACNRLLSGEYTDKLLQLSFCSMCAYGLFAGLSIAASQIFIAIAIVAWAIHLCKTSSPERRKALQSFFISTEVKLFTFAILSWILAAFLASLAGINLSRSFVAVLKTLWCATLPFCMAYVFCYSTDGKHQIARRIWIFGLLLIVGQSLAALHSTISAVLGFEIRPKIPGPVTESGQLVLVIPLLLWLIYHYRISADPQKNYLKYLSEIISIIATVCLTLLAWPEAISTAPEAVHLIRTVIYVVMGIFLTLAAIVYLKSKRSRFEIIFALTSILLFTALIVNLKRGPWIGVFVSTAFLGQLVFRGLLPKMIAFSTLAACIPAVQARLASFADHFFIAGGRKSMWSLGMDLAERFPLGLGLGNSQYMRKIDPSLPLLHRHMHNNLLNITVETGLIGGIAFIWWMYAAVSLGINFWKSHQSGSDRSGNSLPVLALCLSGALLGWQVAGLVEYNFGDGEIQLIAFSYMGILLGLSFKFGLVKKSLTEN